jgi:peptide deformylase
MSILKILQYPDNGLRRIGIEVTDTNDKVIQKLIDDLFETTVHLGSCAGLAATQMDVENAPRLFVMNRPEEEGGQLCFINPEILEMEGSEIGSEGCMSIYPDQIVVQLSRATKVKVRALDRQGKSFTMDFTDFWARNVQHEVDHLNGVLFLDRLSSLKRERTLKKIERILRQ